MFQPEDLGEAGLWHLLSRYHRRDDESLTISLLHEVGPLICPDKAEYL